MVAKKGEKNRWHFAHHKVEIGESCAESAIHAAAKQVLLEQNWLRLPSMRVVVSGQTISGLMMEESSLLSEERIVRFERTCAEVNIGGIRPDIIGYRAERQFLVEMYFRHKVDDDKRSTLGQLKLPAIEVNLSDLDAVTGFDAISERVLHETTHKSWLFFPNEELERQRLSVRLAYRIEQANNDHRTKQAAELERQATRQRQLEHDRKHRQEAALRYRNMSTQDKERDLRERLGIVARWPYYLCKESDGESAIAERAMIWQAALFSRFIFQKVNNSFELKHASVLQWVIERFETESSTLKVVDAQIRRYLGYLSACGFLKKLPYNPYESQGYIVVYGELAPPPRLQHTRTAPNSQLAVPPKVVQHSPAAVTRWIWRASWPKWNAIAEEAAILLAASAHAIYLEALLQGISPLSRPDDPLECAEILEGWGVPKEDVMSFLEKLGLVLKSRSDASLG
ncbi:hypothetical protein [Duganella sp. S19_KUP01_CR8]|uniref:hypothetical protein n=1 Tax=Duganella sp. S19_KUP01_CR8 TaxID=3025502 RepID=UPI002FCD92E1